MSFQFYFFFFGILLKMKVQLAKCKNKNCGWRFIYLHEITLLRKIAVLDKKKSYPASVAEWFVKDRTSEIISPLKNNFISTLAAAEREVVSIIIKEMIYLLI